MTKAYDEIVNFIASGTSPESVAFSRSEGTGRRANREGKRGWIVNGRDDRIKPIHPARAHHAARKSQS